MHDNCEYNQANMNCWLNFSNSVKKALESKKQQIDCKEIILIALEEPEDE